MPRGGLTHVTLGSTNAAYAPISTVAPASQVSSSSLFGKPKEPIPVMLTRKFVFGVSTVECNAGIQYLDEFTAIWSAGRYVVIYDTYQPSKQTFLYTQDACEYVSCMATSNNKKFLAIAEAARLPSSNFDAGARKKRGKSEEGIASGGDEFFKPIISIYQYDPQKHPKFILRKTLEYKELGSHEYVSICFSADGRYLLTLGGPPDWTLMLWFVEKGRHITALPLVSININMATDDEFRLTHCTVCPGDPTLFCVSGTRHFHFYRYVDGQIQLIPGGMPPEMRMNYTSHIWLPPEDRIIVSTDNGDLLLVENGEYRFTLSFSLSDGLSINSLAVTSKGFVCGGDRGLITIIEKTDDQQLYRKMRTISVTSEISGKDGGDNEIGSSEMSDLSQCKILSFSVSPPPGEENVGFLTSDNQVMLFNVSNADFSRVDDKICEYMCQPAHKGAITGMDICIRKPLIVTCGIDRKVILWNYDKNTVACQKQFNTDLFSVAIHPSGLHLIVGFTDKLCFMNIYDQDIREFRAYGVRSCSECHFSPGGQYFAAVTSTVIQVYNTYTCELIGYLRGHNAKIRNISFLEGSDTVLLSAGSDGAIMEFSLEEFQKQNDHVTKALAYNAVVGNQTSIWGGGNDRKLRHFDPALLHPQMEYDLAGSAVMCLAISSPLKLLFAGLDDGTLRVFNTFLAERIAQDRKKMAGPSANIFSSGGSEGTGGDYSGGEGAGMGFSSDSHDSSLVSTTASGKKAQPRILVETHIAHRTAVTRICLSPDGELVVTAGADGLLTIWEVTAPHKPSKRAVKYLEEILIERRDLDELNFNIEQLQHKKNELRQRAIQQAARRRHKHEDLIFKLEDEHCEEEARENSQFTKLNHEMLQENLRHIDLLRDLDLRFTQDCARIEQDYNGKIETMKGQCEKVKKRLEDQKRDFEVELEKRQEKGDTMLKENEALHEAELEEVAKNVKALMAEESETKADHEMIEELIEQETDLEITAIKEAFERQRAQEELLISKLQAENSTLLSDENIKRQELEIKKTSIAERLKQQASLDLQVESLTRDIDALNNEFKERGETIGDKEKRIYELKKTNQELEKLKFVLEYKIKEIKSQIDPRELAIWEARGKFEDMNAESRKYINSSDALRLQIETLKLKLNALCKEEAELENKKKELVEYQGRFQSSLTDAYKESDQKKLKGLAKILYFKYSQDNPEASDGDVNLTSFLNKALAGCKDDGGQEGGGTSIHALQTCTREEAQREYDRRREYMERTLANLKRNFFKDAESARSGRTKIMSENVTLIKEINELRKEARGLILLKKKFAVDSSNGSVSAASGGTGKGMSVSESVREGKGGGFAAAPAPTADERDKELAMLTERQLQREIQVLRAEMIRLRGKLQDVEEGGGVENNNNNVD